MARPKKFDRNTALRNAMELFWAKGYEGTSLSDLTQTMGISRSSLYETFGDKQDLFVEALNHYIEHNELSKQKFISNSISAKQAIGNFLSTAITFLLKENLPGGCFFTNTATALGTLDKQIQDIIKSGLKKQEEFFYTLLERAKQNGEITNDKDTRSLARFFVGLVRGMTVIARVTKERKTLEDIVHIGLEVLD